VFSLFPLHNTAAWLTAAVLILLARPAGAEGDFLQHLLAPGDFSPFHQHISGIKNCGKCHSIGKGVAGGKCLACHQAVAERLRTRKGRHGRLDGECVTCHKEHGKPVVAFDRASFDHGEAVFPLSGRHLQVKCEKCHLRPEKLTGKKRFTYIGLPTDCNGCHANPHQASLADCARCHGPRGWRRVTFDHNAAASPFPLTGLHAGLACGKCHRDYAAGRETAVGGERKRLSFARAGFDRCAACHQDRHQGRLSAKCTDCHSEKGWKPARYDHAKSRFPLAGPHRKLACAACHVSPAIKGLPTDCGGCHKKTPHGGTPTPCTACHSQQSWRDLAPPGPLQRALHQRFRYPLNGAHAKVACDKCHERSGKRRYFRMAFADCADCHRDKHNGELAPPCGRCHVVTGFKEMTSFDHGRTAFPLDGPHKMVACGKCHPGNDFRGAPRRCSRCHLDIARFQRGFYRRTSMDLVSPKAKIVACTGCHKTGESNSKVTGRACLACHQEVYARFFDQWRRLFAAEAGAIESEMDSIRQCRPDAAMDIELAKVREKLDFLQKNFEHNYRFTGAMLGAIRRDLSGVYHAYCEE